jgi:hypothetical protein
MAYNPTGLKIPSPKGNIRGGKKFMQPSRVDPGSMKSATKRPAQGRPFSKLWRFGSGRYQYLIGT